MTSSLSSQELRARAELRRAWLHLSWADIQGARDALACAQRLLPDHPLPITMAGAMELAAGNLTHALRQLKQATRTWPTSPSAHLYFAETCLLLGRSRQARKALELARAHDHDSHWSEHIACVEACLAATLELTPAPPLTLGS